MAEHSRYYVTDNDAGVSKGILKNKLGIKSKKKLSEAETLLLADSYTHFFELSQQKKVKFDLSLLFFIHRYFLSTLYDWAGKVRTVNISKGEMLFAPAKYIDQVLKDFEQILITTLPKQSDDKSSAVQKLAVIHNEYNIIHPFREGNGRTIRLFLDLIAVSLGYDPIDWSKTPNKNYLRACVQGARGNSAPMTRIIKKGLKTARKDNVVKYST